MLLFVIHGSYDSLMDTKLYAKNIQEWICIQDVHVC